MRTLLEVNPLLHHERTGIPTYVEGLCRALLSSSLPDEEWRLWGPDLERDPLPDLPNKRFRGRRFLPRAVLERFWKVADLEAVGPDIDVYHLPFPGMPAPRRSRRTRLVVSILDLAFARCPETIMDPWFIRTLTEWFSAQVDQADAILTISESSKRDLQEILDADPSRIHVSYLGTDLRPPSEEDLRGETPLAREIKTPERYLLTVGTWEPRKNLPTVLRAVHRLADRLRRENVRLCMAGGSRWVYQDADRLIENLGLTDLVVPLGYVPRAWLPVLYARAELFLYPSLYEGFGLPVLEAMACGAPVITSSVSSLPEVAGDAAVMVDPHDLDALTGAVERLLDDPAERERRIALGRAQAARFSWEQTARQTREAYRRALDR